MATPRLDTTVPIKKKAPRAPGSVICIGQASPSIVKHGLLTGAQTAQSRGIDATNKKSPSANRGFSYLAEGNLTLRSPCRPCHRRASAGGRERAHFSAALPPWPRS